MARTGSSRAPRPEAIYIDHTTNSPNVVRRVGAALGERGAQMLDAPMDGGREGALAGSLTLFAGGDDQVLERARPVLEAYSASIVWDRRNRAAGAATKIAHNALAMSIDPAGDRVPDPRGQGRGRASPADRGLPKRMRRGRKTPCSTSGCRPRCFGADFSPRFALRLALKGLWTGGSPGLRARGAHKDRGAVRG